MDMISLLWHITECGLCIQELASLGACEECGLSGPTLALPGLNLLLNGISSHWGVHVNREQSYLSMQRYNRDIEDSLEI